MARLPLTNAEVFYSYTITYEGDPIGTLREFTPSQTRTHEYIREIATNGGDVVEIVPGVPTYQISLNKVRLYEQTLLGKFNIQSENIQKQIQSFDILETVWKPSGETNAGADASPGNILRTSTYEGCWITDWGKSVSSEGILIIENMTVQCTRIVAA